MEPNRWNRLGNRWLYVVVAATALMSTGCQVDIAGQTLPSPWYHYDDIQYFAPGPEFRLAREAAAMQKYEAEQRLDEELPPQ